MRTTPIEILIVFVRKLESLYAEDKEMSLLQAMCDREFVLLLQFSLMLGEQIKATGFESLQPLDPQSLTEADLQVLKQAIVQYLPQ